MALTDLLNTTTQSLSNGITGLPLSAAMDSTEAWQQHFLQSGDPALQNIAREIGNLQSLLSSEKTAGLDGRAIGRSLSMLGSQTAEVARTASAEVRSKLTALSDQLLKAGGQLEDQA
ncbi:hypothetical protein [Hymenobacter glacieicola]|uniref:Uncharacterized protein n=1 Tax=Hymenobacter glacieicola TaxID=1562124 RepID=A0ABQ1X204_9BACT|nr:hypothetical protein [Hymenobacter glacieicola]GGG52111.1 hypothetical protein GCM10011378_30480 [Hymenobacter glacieicola]